jgi:hypothetical protein
MAGWESAAMSTPEISTPERYRSLGMFAERQGATTLEGIDSVTGLPVLIYKFEGSPLAEPGRIASEGVPAILWSAGEDGHGRLVAALAPGWRRRRPSDGPLRPAELLDASLALRDAAAAGLSHGDLRPERLLLSGARLQIEGFGVPWRPEPGPFTAPEAEASATPEGDVWSLAAIVRALGTTVRDGTVSAVLELCQAADPGDRPTAEELYLALERLVPEAESTPPVESAAAGGQPPDGGPAPGTPPPPAGTVAGGSTNSDLTGAAAPASPANGGSTEGSAASAARVAPREKDQPATYDGGKDSSDDGGDGRRRLALLGVLMTAVVVLALLAVYGPRGGAPAAVREATVYVVEVFVAPDDLPPVTIHLLSSPPGSSLARGDRLGTAPRHLALDRAGTWVFQGSLQERRSEPVEISVPEQRSLTLTLPAVGADP